MSGVSQLTRRQRCLSLDDVIPAAVTEPVHGSAASLSFLDDSHWLNDDGLDDVMAAEGGVQSPMKCSLSQRDWSESSCVIVYCVKLC